MNKEKLEYFKNKLLEEKKEQEESLENREKEKKDTLDSLDSELSSYGNHPADAGTQLYMMEQERAYKEEIKDTIKEINSSLEDIENGNYGICDNCNKEIKEARLELIPYAKTCLGCSNEEEGFDEEIEDDEKEYETLDSESFDLERDKKKNNVGYDKKDAYEDLMQDNRGIEDKEYGAESDTIEDVENISEDYYEDTLE